LVIALLVNLFGGNLTNFVILFSKEKICVSSGTIGMLLGTCSLGSLLGSIAYVKIFSSSKIKILFILLLWDALFRQLLPFTDNFVLTSILMSQTYFVMSLINIFIISERQKSVPSELLGKATSVFRTASIGSRPLAGLIAGITMSFFNIKTSFIINNMFYMIAILYILSQLRHKSR
jgi:hypothetical protein